METNKNIPECKFKEGDRVMCLYKDAAHNFWHELLNDFPTIKEIRYVEGASLFKFTFEEDDVKDNWFYENDFIKIDWKQQEELEEQERLRNE